MAKKIQEEEDVETTEQVEAPALRLNFDFGREDLNEMQKAINELFQR